MTYYVLCTCELGEACVFSFHDPKNMVRWLSYAARHNQVSHVINVWEVGS